MSTYIVVFEKSSHTPIELKHRAYWTIKELNIDLKAVGEKILLELSELEEISWMLMKMLRFIKKRLNIGMTSIFRLKTSKWGIKCYSSTQDLSYS